VNGLKNTQAFDLNSNIIVTIKLGFEFLILVVMTVVELCNLTGMHWNSCNGRQSLGSDVYKRTYHAYKQDRAIGIEIFNYMQRQTIEHPETLPPQLIRDRFEQDPNRILPHLQKELL
jgi:hypothetical protein